MGKKERKEEEQRILNYSIEEDVKKKEKEIEVFDIIRTVMFFASIIIAILSIVFAKWVLLILSIFAIIISVPFKYIIKLFPNNEKLYNFLYPKFIPEEHNIELIENDSIDSKNILKRNKAKKEVLNNRKEAQNEVNKAFNNATLIRLMSMLLVVPFVISSIPLILVPKEKLETKPEETTTAIVTTTKSTTTATTTITTTTTTTKSTQKKDIHLSPSQEVFYLYTDEADEEHVFWLKRDNNSDILDSDLIVEPVIEDNSIISVKIVESEGFDYTVFVTPKKAGTTDLSFKSNKDNYKFGTITITVRDPETTTKDNSRTVYVSPTGECYHYDKDCGGDNSYPITLNEAKSRNYRPCEKCT